jgi:hypothetical protein
MSDYQLSATGVVRNSDGANIPIDPNNRDWRKYQEWKAAGGTPDPIPVVTKPSIGDLVDAEIEDSKVVAAMIRRIAKKEGIAEKDLIDEIKSEAKE